MLKSDRIRLQHVIEAAKEAIAFLTGKSKADLISDRKLALAVVKSIEIAGEASSKITESQRLEPSQIPWQDMIAMRNRLIHGYFDIDWILFGILSRKSCHRWLRN